MRHAQLKDKLSLGMVFGTGPLGDDLCDEFPTGQGREVRVYPDVSPVWQGGGVGKR
jgi:hypothetical protein